MQRQVLIVGGGIAGLYTALKAAEAGPVTVIAKKSLAESNTRYAQGGIAAVFSGEDSPAFHLEDTLMAGAGLCSKDAVKVLVHEGSEGVRELIRYGTHFDEENGAYALTREGAHSRRRILHAQGDATGAEIVRALSLKARSHPNIEIWDDHFAFDLWVESGECLGVLLLNPQGRVTAVSAKATVLCTGGGGQLYRYTTNPDIATADGVAMAYRAGAEIRDMEFIQFHPTVLCYPEAPRFLISEAVRGEGALLRNIQGERFMKEYSPQLELAPRDIVARAILNEMEQTGSPFVYLDITREPAEMVRSRFPTIHDFCLRYGLDLTRDWIPVAPAAHYMMGGVKTGLHGETNLRRLFACGEVSSTGVHGANRLASNSLSEAVVFGRRIAESIGRLPALDVLPPLGEAPDLNGERADVLQLENEPVMQRRLNLQKLMLRQVGIRRSEQGLRNALDELRAEAAYLQAGIAGGRQEIEYANLLTCSLLAAESALARRESRGAHFREDFPERDDKKWRQHIIHGRKRGKWLEPELSAEHEPITEIQEAGDV